MKIRLTKEYSSMTGEVPAGTVFEVVEWVTGTFPRIYINGERAMPYPGEYEVIDEDSAD